MAATEDSPPLALSNKQSTISSTIGQLKSSDASKSENGEAVNALKLEKTCENQLKASVSGATAVSRDAFRQAVETTLKEKLFHTSSNDIYNGGVAGFIDYLPNGAAVRRNVLDLWHQHFVLEEGMLEVFCSSVTPEKVFKASGHVDKFTDYMVKDEVTGECYRADHLVKEFCEDKLKKDPTMSADKAAEFKKVLAVLDDLKIDKLGAKIKEYGIVAPVTKNPLSDPYPFNLMFQTRIGPSRASTGYMRPELAQGIFTNFNKLYEHNKEKLPFAAFQIGQAFRNEISPRQGLIRVREFTLAEIEHFMDPNDKSHPKYSEVSHLEFLMFPRHEQESGQPAKRLCLGEAVSKGIVDSQTLAYFMGRVYLFLTRLGIDEKRFRFRQHLGNEMAHYAVACWDAEIECSHGWIECVGIADRSDHDLRAHSEASRTRLVAREKYAVPKEVEVLDITPAKKELGRVFKGNQETVAKALEAMNEEEAMDMKADLETKEEREFKVCKQPVMIKKIKKVYVREFTPHVIEPSFGIGRIMYCLYEHCFYTRPSKAGDQLLNVFRFHPLVAPIRCTVFPLVKNQQYEEVAEQISRSLTRARISNMKDTSGTTIGKKYARTDEIGVPFAVTVDSTTSVTIRERDSKDQIRVKVDDVAAVVKDLSEGLCTWADILQKYHINHARPTFSFTFKQIIRFFLHHCRPFFKQNN